MLQAFAATVARITTNRAAGLVANKLVDMGADALIDLVGGASSPFGTLVRSYLRQSSAEDRRQSRLQEVQNKIEHAQWLKDNRWRFDWRSQPRRPAGNDQGGEWMPGRLDYQAEQKNPISRSQMRRRTRAMRQYKQRRAALGATRSRKIRSAWGDF